MNKEEVWKDVKNYEGYYQVSSFGRVKSIDRIVKRSGVYDINIKGRILKQSSCIYGYRHVGICKNGNSLVIKVHKLVAMAFLDYKTYNICGLVINHINFNKSDNRVENLEIVTQRENSNRKHLNSTSKYIGVSWFSRDSKWRAYIKHKGKFIHLGMFNCEILASKAYQNKLKEIKEGGSNV